MAGGLGRRPRRGHGEGGERRSSGWTRRCRSDPRGTASRAPGPWPRKPRPCWEESAGDNRWVPAWWGETAGSARSLEKNNTGPHYSQRGRANGRALTRAKGPVALFRWRNHSFHPLLSPHQPSQPDGNQSSTSSVFPVLLQSERKGLIPNKEKARCRT